MTVTATRAAASALDILKAGACSAACLLSADTARCRCCCGGAHHGELLRAIQTGAETSTPAGRKLSRAARRRRKHAQPGSTA